MIFVIRVPKLEVIGALGLAEAKINVVGAPCIAKKVVGILLDYLHKVAGTPVPMALTLLRYAGLGVGAPPAAAAPGPPSAPLAHSSS